MKIILHAGAHFTDRGKLLKCLLRNKDDFGRRGISVPGPSRYRPLLRAGFGATDQDNALLRDTLIEEMLDGEEAHRILLSDPNLFGAPSAAVRNGVLYPLAPDRLQRLAKVFARDELTLCMGICNPASFLSAMLDWHEQSDQAVRMEPGSAQDIRWSDTIGALRRAAPGVPLTIWCNEDTPLIWAHLVKDMAGLRDDEKIVGGFTILESIMSREGMQQFRAHLKAHPREPEHQKRQVMAEYLEKYVMMETVEEELDRPGWTEEVIRDLTEAYDADVARIGQIPGVRLLSA